MNTQKLVSEWTGPWKVASDDREYVHTVENMVSGEVQDAHTRGSDAVLRR